MENLNAEQIKKALECCVKAETHLDCRKLKCPALINDECIYIGETDEDCDRQQLADALTLITSQEQRIKELTAKIKKWEEECDLRGDMWCKLNEENKRLTEENERLRVVLKMNDAPFPEGLQIVHDFCEKGKRKAKADTVRKMHSMLCEGRVSNDNVVIVANQVAKEMLEGV